VGYETVHWSFAYNDWDTANQPDPEEALEQILTSHHDGAIYLLHAVSITNAEILGDVIDQLQDMGYRLQVLS
jgi:peptidoglycan-N-acetylmuramic acid deacetylase